MQKNRRKFLKTIGAGVTGAMVSPDQLWAQATEPLHRAITTLKKTKINKTKTKKKLKKT